MITSDRASRLRFSIDRGANRIVMAPKAPKSRGQDPVDLGFVRLIKELSVVSHLVFSSRSTVVLGNAFIPLSSI